jgi:hypothetical protein
MILNASDGIIPLNDLGPRRRGLKGFDVKVQHFFSQGDATYNFHRR